MGGRGKEGGALGCVGGERSREEKERRVGFMTGRMGR